MATKTEDYKDDILIKLIDLIEDARRAIVDREAVEEATRRSQYTASSNAWRF